LKKKLKHLILPNGKQMQDQIKVIPVACAIIEHNQHYLLCKRSPENDNAGLWEFPGGKVNDGESLKACIERELFEELGVKSEASAFLASSDTLVGDEIIRLYGLQVVLEQEPVLAQLKVHSEFKWVSANGLIEYALTKPDLALVHFLSPKLLREHEVLHIDVGRAAKLYGFFYGIFGTLMEIYLLFLKHQPSSVGFDGGKLYRFTSVISLPFINFGVGVLIGAVLAVFYNFISTIIGGLKLRIK
jgi:(d)CTP diphosphatase